MRNFLIVFFVCWASFIEAQQTIFSIVDPSSDNEGLHLIRKDTCLFLSYNVNNHYLASIGVGKILKLNENGTLLKEVDLFCVDSIWRTQAGALQIKGDSLYCIGSRNIAQIINQTYLFIFDLDLNFIDSIRIDNSSLWGTFNTVFNFHLGEKFITLYGFKNSGISIRGIVEQRKITDHRIVHSTDTFPSYIVGFNPIKINRFLLTDWLGGYYYTDSNFVVLESNIPSGSLSWLSHGSYNLREKAIRYGTFYYPKFDIIDTDTIVFSKDSLPQQLPNSYLNVSSRPGVYAFDCIDSSLCYFGVTHNWSSPVLENKPMWITIYAVDLIGNVHWFRHFGGDANYQLFSLATSSDSGVFFVSNRYDWNMQINERDMFIQKIGKDGNILGLTYNSPQYEYPILVYPNPFFDQLILELMIKEKNVIISINDALGNNLVNDVFSIGFDGKIFINTSGWNSGVYFLTIFSKSGVKLKTERIVKL